jgi:aryl-alcohol dehydrogenase-like predicted oxidoreductase
MRYVQIPGTDLKPACISLGTGNVGDTVDKPLAFRIFDAYVDLGGNFIDTAKVYSDWALGERSASEKTIGEWMLQHHTRNKIVLATKGGHPGLEAMLTPRLSPAEILGDLEDSLHHLQVDVVDLYYLHRDDPERPVEEMLETLDAQVKAGKIRYYACSNWRTQRIQEAQEYACSHGLRGFVASQVLWNVGVLDPKGIGDPTISWMDDDMWLYHSQCGMAAMAYTAQANGFFQKMLNDKIDEIDPKLLRMYDYAVNIKRFWRMKRLMAEEALSITQVLLGYLTSQPFPTFPVVGCRSVAQLEDCMEAADVTLTDAQIAFIIAGAGEEKG